MVEASSARSPGPTSASRIARVGALTATSLGFGVVQLDVSVVNVAVKSIGASLGGNVAGLQWVVNAYTVTFAAFILSAGALGDRIGARRVFLAGFALFTAASVACGLAANLGMLIAARAVQGAGAAMLVPCSLTLLNHAYQDTDARRRAVGLWTAGASVALSAGPLIGGLLIASSGWRAIFFINLPIGLLAIGLTLRYTEETTRSRDRGIDLPGQLAAVIALTLLAAAMVAGGQRGFTEPLVLAGLGLAVLAAVGFVLIERWRTAPMLPLRLFTAPTFAAATAIGLVINIAFYGLIFLLSLYFQTSLGYSALRTGLAFAPATVAVLVANLATSRLTKRFGVRSVLITGGLAMAASTAGLLVASRSTGYLDIVVPLVVLGVALGTIVPTMTAALLASVPVSWSGTASGTLNTARQTGSVVGVALFGALAAHHLIAGLRLSLIISIGLALTATALSTSVAAGDPDPADH